MTKQLFEHAYTASLDEQLALEAALQQAATRDGGLRRGRAGVPREACAGLHGRVAGRVAWTANRRPTTPSRQLSVGRYSTHGALRVHARRRILGAPIFVNSSAQIGIRLAPNSGRAKIPEAAAFAAEACLGSSTVEIRTVDYHTAGEPFRIVTGGVESPRARPSSTSGAMRSSASTTCAGCSSTSHADTRTCTAASSSSRTTRAPISASSSSTTRATRPRAATGRSRSSRGRSTRASSSGDEGENHVVVDVPSGRLGRLGSRPVPGASSRCGSATSPSFVWAEGVELGDRDGGRRLRWRVLRLARGARRPERAAAAHRARAAAQARARGVAGRRPSPRAGAPRRLRRRLLAGGGTRAR